MLALEGVKILDLTRAGPGPFCTMILGDLDAEVIKIEAPPAAGERQAGSFHSPVGEEGKRHISVFTATRRAWRLICRWRPGAVSSTRWRRRRTLLWRDSDRGW